VSKNCFLLSKYLNYFDYSLSEEGINYYIDKQKYDNDDPGSQKGRKCKNYWTLFRYFHECPMVKLCYHFVRTYFHFVSKTEEEKTSFLI
jgi:hypothetical protein